MSNINSLSSLSFLNDAAAGTQQLGASFNQSLHNNLSVSQTSGNFNSGSVNSSNSTDIVKSVGNFFDSKNEMISNFMFRKDRVSNTGSIGNLNNAIDKFAIHNNDMYKAQLSLVEMYNILAMEQAVVTNASKLLNGGG